MDLNNLDIKTLERYKDAVNEVIDRRINEADIRDTAERVKDFSFGKIKYLFEALSESLFESEKGKKLIGKYVKACKNSDGISDYVRISEDIKNIHGIEDTKTYLSEALAACVNIAHSELKGLGEITSDCILETKTTGKIVDSILAEYDGSVDKVIEESIMTKKTLSNAKKRANNIVRLSEMIGDRRSEKEAYDEVKVSDGMKQLNKIISVPEGIKRLNALMNEDEGLKSLVGEIFINCVAGGSNSDLFSSYKDKCASILEEKIELSEDVSEISRLNSMKDAIMEKVFNEETFYDDIITLNELKNTLEG